MKINRKFLIIGAVVVLVAVGATLGGVAIAQANDQGSNSTTSSQLTTLMEKVASIYQQNTGVAIDPQQLATAFSQAQQEMRSDALDNYLNKLVQDGKITQDQANQFKNWLNSRPDVPQILGPRGGFHGMMRGGWGQLPSQSTN